ncbi:MAG: hypothetical protein ACUVV0_03650 [Anaerolineae bacterium]
MVPNEEIVGVGKDGGEAYRQAEKVRPGVNPLDDHHQMLCKSHS